MTPVGGSAAHQPQAAEPPSRGSSSTSGTACTRHPLAFAVSP